MHAIKKPAFMRAFRIPRTFLGIELVEVAGIEPASVDPTLTGNYMLSLYFKLTDWPVDRQTYRSASPITFSS